MINLKFIMKNVMNHYAQKASYYLENPICHPTMIHFAPTLRCNLRCRYCSIWKESWKEEISLEEWKMFLNKLHEWVGDAHIGITGGEPLLRKDIFEILEHMRKLGLKTSFTTNGTLLNEKVIKKLSNSDIFNINVSLESAQKELHDFFRGNGNFKKTFDNLLKLREELNENNSKTLLVVETILTSKNLDTAIELLKLCEKNKMKVHFGNIVENLQINYTGDFKAESEYKPKNNKNIDKIFSYLIKNKTNILNSTSELNMIKDYYKNRKIDFKCFANVRTLFISSNGDVKLCQYTQPIGNIKEDNIKKIWLSERANKQRKFIKECKKICQFDCYKKRSLYEEYEMYKGLYC